MFGKLLGAAVDAVTAPVRMTACAVEIACGITQGELRTEAIRQLGWDTVNEMTQAELIEWYLD